MISYARATRGSPRGEGRSANNKRGQGGLRCMAVLENPISRTLARLADSDSNSNSNSNSNILIIVIVVVIRIQLHYSNSNCSSKNHTNSQ